MSEITFSDVLIEPQYSEVLSRSNCDTSSQFDKFTLDLPVFSANMKHITGPKMCYHLALNGGFGILHRFNSAEDAVEDFHITQNMLNGNHENFTAIVKSIAETTYRFGVSIGVKEVDKARFIRLYEAGARVFCIDVAHGHHLLMKQMIQWIRQQTRNDKNVVLIAGNVATGQGAVDLHNWGASIIKVGIGPGAVCQTRKNTGVGVPQLSALKTIREYANEKKLALKLIADGGVKTGGDVAKALKYADAVMLGSFIAGTSETPGDVFEDPSGNFYKVYGGSASAENKVQGGKENKFVEGVMTTVPFRGHVKYLLKRIREGIQSAFSYVGAHNLVEFQEKAVLKTISGGGKAESKLQ